MRYVVNTAFRLSVSKGQIYDPATILEYLLREHCVEKVEAPEIIEEDAADPKWNGKYIVHISGKDELKRCLKDLGVPVNGNPSVQTLIAKRDEYLNQIRENRKAD